MKKALKKTLKRSVWGVSTLFTSIMFTIFAVAEEAVVPYEGWIDNYFNVRRTFIVEKEDGEQENTDYYPTKYPLFKAEKDGKPQENLDSLYKMQRDGLVTGEKVNNEGIVLLWNKNNALPLNPTKEKNISSYGIMGHAYKKGDEWFDNWPYHATGSATTDLRKGIGMLEIEGYPELNVGPRFQKSMEEKGFNFNKSLIESIWKNGDQTQMNGYEAPKKTKKEVPWDTLKNDTENNPIQATTDSYNDCVFYTVGRWTGEGQNVDKEVNLSAEEASVLKGLSDLRKQNKIKKLVVILAFANPMNIDTFKDYEIDAALWAGNGGSTATEALANIISGEVSPSGKLPDTWAFNAESMPSTQNFVKHETINNYYYTNKDQIPVNEDEGEASNSYLVYQEGIYVGYKYYETRYEDLVMKKGNASSAKGVISGTGTWDYNKEVAYPFGHGLSYTTFEYSNFEVDKKDDNYHVTATIKNTGNVSGKEVFQVYLQKPYTEYDKTTGIEKSAVDLVGYTKTDVLEPNQSTEVEVIVPESEFKTYDSYGKKTYILEKGDYYLAAGRDSHDATNNILAAKNFTKADGMDEEGNKGLTHKVGLWLDDFEKYSTSVTGNEVTNRFDDVDINLYKNAGGQKVTYLSRSDWDKTYPATPIRLTATPEMINALKKEQAIANDPNAKMPTYGTDTSEYGHLNLIQMKDVPYSDPLWQDFLNQLTFEEQVELLKGSMKPIQSIAANEGDVYDGPIGLRDGYLGELGARCAFPCAPIVSATFNDKLIEEMSEAFGEVLRQHGNNGVWGTSTNVHRTPYNGRNNEYYSEDGFLAGKMTANANRGLISKGLVVYTKHFLLNECEIVRSGTCTWANEQSIRELYLKAYEAGVIEGKGNGIMTSYNRLGVTWSGNHKGLLTDILRNEWGFTGVACTDWNDRAYMGKGNVTAVVNAVIAGQDEWIYNIIDDKINEYKTNPTFCQALRESAHRNLYTRIYTSAMNGIGKNTDIITIIPQWQQAITTMKIVGATLMGVTIALTLASWGLWFYDRKKA